MSENVQFKPGRDSSEYGIVRLLVLAGLALMLGSLAMLGFGKVNIGDPGWSEYLDFLKWIAGIGAGLCGAVATWYTTKRTDLKKTLTAGLMVICVLCLLAAPALAGTIGGASTASDPATPAVGTVTSTPEAPSTATSTVDAAWNKIKAALGMKQDGRALTAEETVKVVEALVKVSQQNLQLKAEVDAAQAKAQVMGPLATNNEYSSLDQLAQQVNRVRIAMALAGGQQNGGTNFYGYPVSQAPLTREQVALIVKEALEDKKKDSTFLDSLLEGGNWYLAISVLVKAGVLTLL